MAENESMSTQGNHGKWKHLVANVRVILDNTFVQLAVGEGGELSGSGVPRQSRRWHSFPLDSCNKKHISLRLWIMRCHQENKIAGQMEQCYC